MATTTPNFGWSVPTSSDLVKNGAVAIETLGDAIDASLVDLKGGTTGQVLSKASGTDMDFTWATASGGSSGLTLISTTTFSGVSSQSVNNCFSSTYANYKIIMNITAFSGTDNAQVRMRLRASGSDNTSTYFTANNYYYGGTTTDTSYENTNGFLAGYAMNNTNEGGSLAIIEMMDPFVATETVMTGIGQTFFSNLGHSYAQRMSGTSFVQSSFDGFTLIPASGTITGKVRVYGYSN